MSWVKTRLMMKKETDSSLVLRHILSIDIPSEIIYHPRSWAVCKSRKSKEGLFVSLRVTHLSSFSRQILLLFSWRRQKRRNRQRLTKQSTSCLCITRYSYECLWQASSCLILHYDWSPNGLQGRSEGWIKSFDRLSSLNELQGTKCLISNIIVVSSLSLFSWHL